MAASVKFLDRVCLGGPGQKNPNTHADRAGKQQARLQKVTACLAPGTAYYRYWQKEGEVGKKGRTGGKGRREVGLWQSASKGSVIYAQRAWPFPIWLFLGAGVVIR